MFGVLIMVDKGTPMNTLQNSKISDLIALSDSYITTTSAILDPDNFADEIKMATILAFHFGVLNIVSAFLNMELEELRAGVFHYYYDSNQRNIEEASYITVKMFELSQTDIGKDIMQHGAFGYDAWVNGTEGAGLALKKLLDETLELDPVGWYTGEYEIDEEDNDFNEDEHDFY